VDAARSEAGAGIGPAHVLKIGQIYYNSMLQLELAQMLCMAGHWTSPESKGRSVFESGPVFSEPVRM
jgi:hypothetical protein